MKKSKGNKPKVALLRYILAGVIVATVTLAMLATSQFIVTGRVQLFSFNIIG